MRSPVDRRIPMPHDSLGTGAGLRVVVQCLIPSGTYLVVRRQGKLWGGRGHLLWAHHTLGEIEWLAQRRPCPVWCQISARSASFESVAAARRSSMVQYHAPRTPFVSLATGESRGTSEPSWKTTT